jgi:hypothetical protein
MGLLENQSSSDYYRNESLHGGYQFMSLDNIVKQFMVAYVGEGKTITKASRIDVGFWAQRALAELSFDTLKSFKSLEVVLPPSLSMVLPQDYVNYTKISFSDSSGIKHPLYPTKHTSNPFRPVVDEDNNFVFNSSDPLGLGTDSLLKSGELVRDGNFLGTEAAVGSTTLKSNNWFVQLPTGQPSTFDDNNDPLSGWFFINNKAQAVDVAEYGKIRQYNAPILSNGSYKVTYTVSGYSSGVVRVRLIDELGKLKTLTLRSSNGTFEETVDMSTGTTVVAGDVNLVSNFWIESGSATESANFTIDKISIVRVGSENESSTVEAFRSTVPAENNNEDYANDDYQRVPDERYGLDPAFAQTNGSFFIDELRGKINFSSNISGKTVILDYISDSLGTEEEMVVHKFAEDAVYKWIYYCILSTKSNIPEYIVRRAQREKFAATRQAKLRLSNIKLEEITQILRGKSKHIKH